MNTELIREIIKLQGLNFSKIARLTHMSQNNLNNKLKGRRDLKISEVIKLKKVLCLSHETMALILFGPEKVKGQTMQGRKPFREEWKYFTNARLDSRDWLVQKSTNELLQIVHKDTGEQKLITKSV